MKKGTVKWFNSKKGFGFVVDDESGKELFVHYSRINSDAGYKSLNEGDKVVFNTEDSEKGIMAVDVTVVK